MIGRVDFQASAVLRSRASSSASTLCAEVLQARQESREAEVLHIFFAMEDGSCIAFFHEPDIAFDFKDQRDFDLHLALEVQPDKLQQMFEMGKRHDPEESWRRLFLRTSRLIFLARE